VSTLGEAIDGCSVRSAPRVASAHPIHASALGWDTGRAVTNFAMILIVGPAALATFRRAARRAAFEAPVAFPT